MICNNCKKEYNGFERQCPYCGALLKTFREANPRPDDIVVVKLAGKIVSTISGVFAAVALIVLAVVVMRSISVAVESGASYGDTLAYDEQELEVAVVEAPALVAEDDMAELSRAIHNSSAGKYSELIELREVMDSLLAFANGTQPELIDLSKQLESKQKEAADAWIKAGDAQYNI
ncbi:MAG: hypothetical protein K2O00_08150, partial [Muribaculaceae bacterium]|nr:hypothetical protein [Muribaculaceae bacterium]